jgi:hypothetical protein
MLARSSLLSTGIAPIFFDEDDNPTINDMIDKVNGLVKRAEEPLTSATGIQNIALKFCPQCGQQVMQIFVYRVINHDLLQFL